MLLKKVNCIKLNKNLILNKRAIENNFLYDHTDLQKIK